MHCLWSIARVGMLGGGILTATLWGVTPSHARDCPDSGTPLTPPCTLQREPWNDHNHTCTTYVCHKGGKLKASCSIGYCREQVRACVNDQWQEYQNHDEYTASWESPWDINPGCYKVTLTRAHQVSGCSNPAEYCGGQLGVASAYQETPDQGPGGVVVEAC
jgi:hypothetical protein